MKLTEMPSLTFARADPEELDAEVCATVAEILGRTPARADPLRLFLRGVENVILQTRLLIDECAKQNLLAYATGDNLEDTITVEVIEDYVTALTITGNIPEMVVDTTSTLHTCTVTVEAIWYSGKDNTIIPSANLLWDDQPTGYISITASGDNETTFEAINADPEGNDVDVTATYHDTVSGEDLTCTVYVTVLSENP